MHQSSWAFGKVKEQNNGFSTENNTLVWPFLSSVGIPQFQLPVEMLTAVVFSFDILAARSADFIASLQKVSAIWEISGGF